MPDQYTPIVGDHSNQYGLAERSTSALRELQELRMRATAVPDARRRELARQWHEEPEEVFEGDQEILPDEYYTRAFEIVAAGIDSLADGKEVRVDVVEEMIDDFLPTGGRGQSGRGSGYADLMRILERSLDQTEMSPTE